MSPLASSLSDQTRSDRPRENVGGRPRISHRRTHRVTVSLYEDEAVDLRVLAEGWEVAEGTLLWAVLCDWLSRQRGVSSDLRDVRGVLRAGLELALRDAELGPWLRREVTRDPLGMGRGDAGEPG